MTAGPARVSLRVRVLDARGGARSARSMNWLLPRTKAHRAACIAAFAPLVLVGLCLLLLFGLKALEDGAIPKLLGISFAVPAILVFGPFASPLVARGGIRLLIPSAALAVPLLYWVLAHTRLGTVPWAWILLGSFVWYGAGSWILMRASIGA